MKSTSSMVAAVGPWVGRQERALAERRTEVWSALLVALGLALALLA